MSKGESSSTVTLRDIAKKMGISHSAVALGLRNSSRISRELRQKIEKVAQDLGYHPNPMATALGHLRSETRRHPVNTEIAWINYWEKPEQLRSYREFDLYWKGAYAAAEQYGYRLEEFSCNKRLSPPQLERILLARNIRGILVPPHRPSDIPPGWKQMHWENFSIVRFGYSVDGLPVHVVTANHLVSGLLAVENIRKLGYGRIGFVTSRSMATRFRAGFFMKNFEPEKEYEGITLILPNEIDTLEDLKILSAWLKKHRPNAILTDIASMRNALEKIGYRVPKDIGLASLSVLDGNADSGIYQNSEEVGRTAAENLISMINRNQYGIPKFVRETLIDGKWVDGTTLPPRRTSKPKAMNANRS